MKKILALLLCVCVACSASSCLALDILDILLEDDSGDWWGGNSSWSSTVEFDVLPYESMPPAQAEYTILIYLNGSDLETDDGSASEDIYEMICARYDRTQINVVIQTGGTRTWHVDGIPNRKLGRFVVGEEALLKIEELPNQNIGDPQTLSDFIDFGVGMFPARRYGLILWNHGGGSIYGFGSDEHFDEDGLTLAEMEQAFAASALAETPLEFLGFDACLMATAETAYAAAPYANYMVASQELEPGYGWNYEGALNALGRNPAMDGAAAGRAFVDSFIAFYVENDMGDEALTLSVLDLDQLPGLMAALEGFAAAASLEHYTYQQIAQARGRVREFGMPQEYGGYTDMVDIGHLAQQFYDLCPGACDDLLAAVQDIVVYCRNGMYVDDACGIALFFPYFEKNEALERTAIYQETPFSPAYVNYVTDFTNVLTGSTLATLDLSAYTPIQTPDDAGADAYDLYLSSEELEEIQSIYFTAWAHVQDDLYVEIYQNSFVEIDDDGRLLSEFDGVITTLNGQWACLYEIESGDAYIRYGVPAILNGAEVTIILLYDDANPQGKILGAMPVYAGEGSYMAPKRLLPIRKGDTITLLYYAESFFDVGMDVPDEAWEAFWYEGEPFEVGGTLALENIEVEEGTFLYGFQVFDLQGNEYFTDFIEIEFYLE